MIAYVDTSALIKMLLIEEDSDIAEALWSGATVVTGIFTYAEARAALAAARRAGRVKSSGSTLAREELETLWHQLDVIDSSETIVRAAGDLSGRHGLRGYDAVHLASALALAGEELMFASLDRELSAAASREGLATAPAF